MSDRDRIIDQPRPGFFKLRMVKGGPWCPARIWPVRRRTGSETLTAHILGEPAEVDRVWLYGREIPEADYQRLMREPPVSPRQPVNFNAMPPLF